MVTSLLKYSRTLLTNKLLPLLPAKNIYLNKIAQILNLAPNLKQCTIFYLRNSLPYIFDETKGCYFQDNLNKQLDLTALN